MTVEDLQYWIIAKLKSGELKEDDKIFLGKIDEYSTDSHLITEDCLSIIDNSLIIT